MLLNIIDSSCYSIFPAVFLILPLSWFCNRSITNKIPGLPASILYGNSDKFLIQKRGYLNGLEECVQPFKNKSICRFWMGMKPYVVFNDSDHLSSIFYKFDAENTAFENEITKAWFGKGILFGDSKKCFFRKKLLEPTFNSSENLERYFEIMNKECDQMISKIKNKLSESNNFELMHFFNECTLNTICETAMGVNINFLKRQKDEYLKALPEFSALICKRIISRGKSPWLLPWFESAYYMSTSDGRQFKESVKTLNKFTQALIYERKKTFYSNKNSFIDVYIDANSEDFLKFNLYDACPEVAAVLFEGHDKIATTLMWACYCVARNPEVQNKLQIELKHTLGDDSNHRKLTMKDLNSLNYLECVLKESLRLFPTVPILYREFIRETNIDCFDVSQGTIALAYIYQIHRDERYFPEPEKFIPERFLPQNHLNLPAYAYIPFCSGRITKGCMGEKFSMIEIKLFMANLLRNFEMTCRQTVDDIMPEMKLLLKPENPIIFNLKPRYDQIEIDKLSQIMIN